MAAGRRRRDELLPNLPAPATYLPTDAALACARFFENLREPRSALHATRIEDLGRGDLVKIDCAACHHVALLTPAALLKLGLSPRAKGLKLKKRRQSPRGTKPKAFTLRLSQSNQEQ
jgi:hypothetical protein